MVLGHVWCVNKSFNAHGARIGDGAGGAGILLLGLLALSICGCFQTLGMPKPKWQINVTERERDNTYTPQVLAPAIQHHKSQKTDTQDV